MGHVLSIRLTSLGNLWLLGHFRLYVAAAAAIDFGSLLALLKLPFAIPQIPKPPKYPKTMALSPEQRVYVPILLVLWRSKHSQIEATPGP